MTTPLTREEVEGWAYTAALCSESARVLALFDALEVAKRERDEARIERNEEAADEAAGRRGLRAELEAARAERDLAAAERDEFMRQRDRAAEALMAAEREADRLRHGAPVEGDFVCPNELALREARGQVAALRDELENALRGADHSVNCNYYDDSGQAECDCWLAQARAVLAAQYAKGAR